MENEDINLEIDLEEEEETPIVEEKPRESDEARISRLERQLAQAKKKAGHSETKPESKKEVGIDKLDRILLRQEGIKSQDEIDLVESIRKDTGKDVEDIIDSRFFQAELKLLREERASKDAVPNGSKRSQQTAKDDVEYWISKGELPKDNPTLRQKVVNERITRERNKNTFSSNAIIE